MSGSDFTVTFSGVGGSCAMSGPSRRRYGSNTPCVSVRAGGRRVLLDMGTGAARLRDIEAADILLSHFHYDHIEGIPFFSPFFTGGRFDIYARPPEGMSVRAALSGLMTRPYLPVTFDSFRAEIRCHDLNGEPFTTAGGIGVVPLALPHPGGCTGFRLEYGGRSLVYLSDCEGGGEELAPFCRGAELVIYDAHFTAEEYKSGRYAGWGHSHHDAGLALAAASGARRVAFTHHAPWRTDDELDALADQVRGAFAGAVIAFENMEIEL